MIQDVGQDLYRRILTDHHGLIRESLADHGGREEGTRGDGFFAVFASCTAAVAAAVQMQRSFDVREWPNGVRVRVRMGVHAGEAEVADTGLVGMDVHRAARVASVAHGGQIVVSDAAAALMRHGLPADVSLRDLGPHWLKDIGQPEHLYQVVAPGLALDFPPLRSLDNPSLQHNLPILTTTFIGRRREVDEVRLHVKSSRLVTLTGAGGCGKTSLAIRAASELLDGSGDGVWLVELAPVNDPSEVSQAIADALGVTVAPRRSVLEGLTDTLAGQRALLVLDNCEHLITMSARVVDVILHQCPQVHVLATSREPLGLAGETVYRVPSLSLPDDEEATSDIESSDAVVLLVERARSQGVDLARDGATLSLAALICRRLDGMPLAIELAAARLRSLSPSDLLDRIDQRFRLLTGGSRSSLPRQQTLRATVDWSYSLLVPAEQAVLGRLSTFVSGFNLTSAEAVVAGGTVDPLDVADIVGSLVDKSLVVAESSGASLRYRLLETIRQFAAERLVDAGVQEAAEAVDAHGRYFLALAEEASDHSSGPDQGEWFARLDVDYANLRRALDNALSNPVTTWDVLRFAVALRRFVLTRSRQPEVLASLLSALERVDASGDPALYSRALSTATIWAMFVDGANAAVISRDALVHAREIGTPLVLFDALSSSAFLHLFTGDSANARPNVDECVELARAMSDDVRLGEALSALYWCESDLEVGEEGPILAEAIACVNRTQDHFMKAAIFNNAAVFALGRRSVAEARRYFEIAIPEFVLVGTVTGHLKGVLAMIELADGNVALALGLFYDEVRAARRRGDRFSLAYVSVGLAVAEANRGRWLQASEVLGVGDQMIESIDQRWVGYAGTYRDDVISSIRAHVVDAEYDEAYARGRQATFDEGTKVLLRAVLDE